MDGAPVGILVVGLGNPILSDDGIGWRVAQAVRAVLDGSPGSVRVTEACVGGLTLAELLVGYRRAVIVDAIMTGLSAPGTVYCFKASELPGTLNTASAHDTNLSTALDTLHRFGADLPTAAAVDIVAVEVQDVWTFSETCTPAVEQSIPAAAAVVLDILRQHGAGPGTA